MKKIIFPLYLIICSLSFTYDTITELYLKGYLANNINIFTPEARVIIDDSSNEDYNLNLELALNDSDSKVDVAKIKFYFENSDLELGRNRIGWGVGTNFNPSDIFNDKPFDSAFDPYFRKEGRDSFIYTRYLDDSNIQAIYTFSSTKTISGLVDERKPDIGLRYKKYIFDFDTEFLYISKGEHKRFIGTTEKQDSLYGFNFKGNIPNTDFGIWNELIYSEEYSKAGTAFGIDTYFADKYYFNLEYYRNYRGENKKENYNPTLFSIQENVGQDYLIPALQIDFNEKFNTYTYAMINLNDSSFVIGDTMNYYYNDIISVNFGLYYQSGPEGSEYRYYSDEYGIINAGGTVKAVF